jgi:hypothetical protein
MNREEVQELLRRQPALQSLVKDVWKRLKILEKRHPDYTPSQLELEQCDFETLERYQQEAYEWITAMQGALLFARCYLTAKEEAVCTALETEIMGN